MLKRKVDTTYHPRILCLHGGGTNGLILEFQARSFIGPLSQEYRLVFADAPFLCEAHPTISPVYDDFAPFRLWYRWKSSQRRPGGDVVYSDNAGSSREHGNGEKHIGAEELEKIRKEEDEVVVREMEYSIKATMEEDDNAGNTGPWVGLLGFSQGARVAGSILFDRQLKIDAAMLGAGMGAGSSSYSVNNVDFGSIPGFAGGFWKFAVIMAGRGPFIALSELGKESGSTAPVTRGIDRMEQNDNGKEIREEEQRTKLRLPTVHIHGYEDPGLAYQREWLAKQYEKGSTTLLEWDGDHRLAFKTDDVTPMVNAILKVGREAR